MRKMWFAVVLLAVFCGTANGQGRVLKVSVDPGDIAEKEVTSGFVAKIGSTLRYTNTEHADKADFIVEITCIRLDERDVACDTNTSYFPVAEDPRYISIRGNLAKGSADYVANAMFNSFVGETSVEKLKEAEDNLKKYSVGIFQEGWDKGEAFGEQACAGKSKTPTK